MIYLRSSVLFFCMCALLSCADKTTLADDKIVLADSENIEEIRYDDSRFIESWSMVELEVGDNGFIGDISQLQLFEDKFYILDKKSNSLAVFNTDGSFSHKIGARGRGPQEYLALCSFYINPDKKRITLFDAMLPRRATVFDIDGKFVATKDIPEEIVTQGFSNVAFIGDGLLVCYANPNGMSEDVLFVLNEEDLSVVDRLAVRPVGLAQMIFTMANQPYSIVNGKLHFVKWFDNNIYEWTRGKTIPLLEIDTGKPLVPERILSTVIENNSGNYLSAVRQLVDEGQYSVGLRDLYETSRFVFCEFRHDGQVLDLLVWDKKQKSSAFVSKRSSLVPNIMKIVFSSDDKLISHWHYSFIDSFQSWLKNGEDVDVSKIDRRILEMLQNYDAASANPVLFVYNIKK